MRKKIWLITLAFLIIPLTVILTIVYKTSTSGTTIVITLEEAGFNPQHLTIKSGDKVQFKSVQGNQFWPASDLHPTHGIYPEFDPQEPIEPTDSWSFKFTKPGFWRYHDHLNPLYRGTITVN